MEQETKNKFDEFDKRLVSTEKRIDDLKWFIGAIMSVFTIVFSLIALLGNLNFSSEKSALREFQRELKSELGRAEIPPEIEMFDDDGSPLANQEVRGEIYEDEDGNLNLLLNMFIKNSGKSLSGKLYVKFYVSDPLKFPNRSSDENEFQYETYLDPGILTPSELPGGFSSEMFYNLIFDKKDPPPAGKYPSLIKVFYGKGKILRVPFIIVFDED